MKTILVTGATGFLGKHLIEQLKASLGSEPCASSQGRLRILCRGASPWDSDPQVDVARGDVASQEDAERATAGVSEIYHLAGVVSRNPRKKWLMYQTHVE